eukprot:XP_015579373.1 uncharacterized protein LOC107261845 [Ricinus communis]
MEKFISSSETRSPTTETAFRNQQASIQNLENQVGQIVKLLSESPQKSLPSNREATPKEQLKVITLHSGKELKTKLNEVDEKSTKTEKVNDEKEGTQADVEDKVEATPKPTPFVKEYQSRRCFPACLQKDKLDAQFRRPFLAIARAIIDVHDAKLILSIGEEQVMFQIPNTMRHPLVLDDMDVSNDRVEHETVNCIPTIIAKDPLELCWVQEHEKCEILGALEQLAYLEAARLMRKQFFKPIEMPKEEKMKPFIEDPSSSKLKQLLEHLEYAFLMDGSKLPVITSSALLNDQKAKLLKVLRRRQRTIAWKIANIKGIIPYFCTHKILKEEEFKTVVQPQRHLNPNMKEVMKKEVIQLLDAEIIYPISDNFWVSPVQVVQNKGGMIVLLIENNELVLTRTVTGWRVCIDYRKLNDSTRKDHFPLPFIDQMLERLSRHAYYYFLDGLSEYFQIPIAP